MRGEDLNAWPPPLKARLLRGRDVNYSSYVRDDLSADAFMQAMGMFNDHVVDCFRHAQVARKATRGRVTDPLPG